MNPRSGRSICNQFIIYYTALLGKHKIGEKNKKRGPPGQCHFVSVILRSAATKNPVLIATKHGILRLREAMTFLILMTLPAGDRVFYDPLSQRLTLMKKLTARTGSAQNSM